MSVASKPSPQIPRSSSTGQRTCSTRVRAVGPEERLLTTLLSGTMQHRRVHAAEICRLASLVDYGQIATGLARARLLPLLGSRLVAAAPESVPADFRTTLQAALAHGRRRAALVEQVTLRVVDSLEAAGVTVVALKGPHLAERLHGDPGMRSSSDIDLLVQPEDFHAAVAALERTGYRSEDKAPWIDDLPLFEASLRSGDAWCPPIDLHWRLHWYEESFSRGFVRRSRPGQRGLRAPRPLDELAALLLFWCRDGLIGLRHAADIAAWWDRHGEQLEPGALDEITRAHPPLLRAFTAAALRTEQVVGVPARRLLSRPDVGRRRARLAARCANVADPVSEAEAEAEIVLVDSLLTPRGGGAALMTRHLLLPLEVIGDIYGLPPHARIRRTLRRGYYAGRVGVRLSRWAVPSLRAALR